MPRPPFAPLALVLAGLVSTGCIHSLEAAGDLARDEGNRTKAAEDYEQALRTNTEEVYAYEKTRIWNKRAQLVIAELREELAAPRGGSPREVVTRLVTLQRRALDLDRSSPLVQEFQRAIDTEASQGLPEIEALVQAKRYGDALPLAAFYASVVSSNHPLRARAAALAPEAIAFHQGLAASATGPGGRLLHTRFAQSFGAPVDPQTGAGVAEVVGVAWNVETKDSSCRALAGPLAARFAQNVGAPGTMTLRLSCSTAKREYDNQERYSYMEIERYREKETRYRDTPIKKYTSRLDCPSDRDIGNGLVRVRPCTPVQDFAGVDIQREEYEVEVNRSREVERWALRDTHHVEYTTTVTGSVDVTALATGPDANVVFSLPVELTATTSASAYKVPELRHIPPGFSAASAEEVALSKAIGLVTALVGKVQEGRAIPYVAQAEAAARAGNRAAAEDGFMIAAEAIGRPAPSFVSMLQEAYGLNPVEPGERLGQVAELDLSVGALPPLFEEEAREDLQFDLFVTRFSSSDAAPQPGRTALAGTMRFGSPVFARIRDTAWGWGLYDFAWFDLSLGMRTAGFTDATGKEEPKLSGAVEIGYRPYFGYRSGRWGVFLGGRWQADALAVGNLHQVGNILSLAGALEWRLGGPSVITLAGWARPASGGRRHTLGGELTLPFGRNNAGLKLGVEKRGLSTSLPRSAEDNTEYDAVGVRDGLVVSVGFSVYGE